MDKRQQEYTEYYQARMKKYEGNPMYANSYLTEKALYELMRDAKTEEEYKEKFFGEKLNLKNAIALTKDRETARLNFYREIKEDIRAQGPEEILKKADQVQSDQELIEMVNKTLAKNSLDISIDGFTDYLYSAFVALENREVWKRAKVPEKYRAKLDKWLSEDLAETRKVWNEVTVPAARQYDPNWKMDYERVWAERHRRNIPVPDSTVKRRIEEHKEMLGNY